MKKIVLLLILVLLSFFGFAQSYSMGDVNHSGSVDIVDALLIAQYYVGENPSNFDSSLADVNCSSSIDIVDGLLIAQLYVNLISQLPCQPTPVPTTEPVTPGPTVASGLPVPPTSGVPKPSGAAGNLVVINWAGFKGAITFTFDDSNSSQINNYSTLNGLGVHFTFYMQSGKTEASNSIWQTALNNGHELGNHTQTHPQTANPSDIDACTTFIQQHYGVTPYTFAAPNGDSSYVSPASSRFLLNRMVSNGNILPNDSHDPFNLPCYIPPTGASASTMNSEIDSARNAGGWKLFLVHGFTGGSDGAYQPVAIGEFTSTVNHAKSFGDMWLDTAVAIGAYWRAQKMLTAVTPAASGSDKVYSWTLPAHFPPGKYLRVKVDGGTLKQGGNILNWDDHGYYEISLDANSLTISP
jgi:peptidoglycan/xylan/chitin deacetylase (PgdA/CDA1 family)